MPSSKQKAIFLTVLVFTILPFVSTQGIAGAVDAAAGVSCGDGAAPFTLDGDLYCGPVRALRYENLNTSGEYNMVRAIKDRGECPSTLKSYSGPLAPFDEEVRLFIYCFSCFHLYPPFHRTHHTPFINKTKQN